MLGSHSTFVAALSHYKELDANLDVLGSRCNTGLKEDEVDTLWPRVCVAADSLTSHVYSLVARNPPNSTGE
jgi:hypothetical protein